MVLGVKQREADFYTLDVDLNNSICLWFSGRFKEQRRDPTNQGVVYCIYGIPERNLLYFLDRMEPSLENQEYDVIVRIDSEKSDFVRIRRDGRVITDSDEIRGILEESYGLRQNPRPSSQ